MINLRHTAPLTLSCLALVATPLTRADDNGALLADDPLAIVNDAIADARAFTEQSANITFNLGYTLIWQFTDNGRVVAPTNSLVTGSYDFDGYWAAVDTDNGIGTGGLGWLAEGGHNIGHNRGEDLSANIGSSLGVNDDADPTTDIALTELWWQHAWGPVTKDEAAHDYRVHNPEWLAARAGEVTRLITVTVGKIDQTVFFDHNRVANDETTQFLATPLVNSVAVAFPDNGLGANVWVQPNEWLYVTGGVGDANASATGSPFTSFDGDELFWAGEVGVTPTIGGLGQGVYRFMVWTTEFDTGGGTADGSGFSISIDQEVTPGVVPFVRYSHGNSSVVGFEHMVSAGVGVEGPLNRPDDMAGIGYVWAESGVPAEGDESLIEAFYRVKVTDTVEITPAVQIVFDPIGNPAEDTVVVGAIRTQFSF